MTTASRRLVVLLAAGGLAAGCTSSGKNGSSGTVSGPGSESTSGPPAATCTKSVAEKARETMITKDGFKPSCVKIKVKAQFFFVNNEKTKHEVATQAGAPASFDVKLPKKTSTYTQVFAKAGTYVVKDTTTGKSMTLYVG